MNFFSKKTLVILLSSFALVGSWAFFFPVSPNQKSFHKFEISQGEPAQKIIKDLKKEQLIHSYFPYRLFFRIKGFKAGEYSLSSSQSPLKIFQILSQGKVVTYNITFPEGMNMFEMASLLDQKQLISKKEFLDFSQNSSFAEKLLGEKLESLEGYLYPETYKITKGMKAQKLIQIMVGEFLKNYKNISSTQTLLPRHHTVILASLVEKETGAEWERPRIASVFHNRLKIGMRLQSDPTILYGMLRETGVMPKNIRKKDILRKTSYNTYTFKGMPKGPISNPGIKALEAVLNPEKTSYYYFVSKNDGTHVFSKNIHSHEKAVDIYQRKLKK